MGRQQSKVFRLQNIYFVVEPERVVALDLALAIRAHDPQAEVRLFSKVDEVLACLAQGTPRAIFLDREPEPFLASVIGQSLAGQGIAMVFTSRMATACPEGAEILALPFSDRTVAAMLRRLTERWPKDDARP